MPDIYRCESVSVGDLVPRSLDLRPDGPGLARGCGAGFLLHPAVPGAAGSYPRSAGVYPLRPTGGELEQVTRGIHVPVQDQAARLAGEDPLSETEAWLSPSALRANPGRGVPPSRSDQAAAILASLA